MKVLFTVKNILSVAVFMVSIRSRTVSRVSGRAGIIQVIEMLLRVRCAAMISAGNLITKSRQQLLCGRVDGQMAKIRDHNRITVRQPKPDLWRKTEDLLTRPYRAPSPVIILN